MTYDNIPLELIEKILNGNCVIFLGDGSVFTERQKVDTQGLVSELLKYCDYDGLDLSLAKVAEHYEISAGRQSLVEKVCNWIEKNWHKPSQIDEMITRLPIDTVVTTRIDLLLEESYRRTDKSLIKVVSDKDVVFGDRQKVLLVNSLPDTFLWRYQTGQSV